MAFEGIQKQETDSFSILHRIAKSDRTAVKDCIDTYGGLVWTLAKKFSASTEEAETAVQDIFLDIWRYAGRWDSKKCAENMFIGLIARRCLIKRPETVKKSETNKGKVKTDGIRKSLTNAVLHHIHKEKL